MNGFPDIIPQGQIPRRKFIQGAVLTGLAAAGCSPNDPFTAAGQKESIASGEMVQLLSVTGEIIEVDRAYLKPVPEMPQVSNEEARIGMPGKKFVMVIDLAHCHNLKKCQSACNKAHLVQ